jgi:hypothetical protein
VLEVGKTSGRREDEKRERRDGYGRSISYSCTKKE